MIPSRPFIAGAVLAAAVAPASATCGSAFCTLMTDRYAQGSGAPHVGWSADLRVERVVQNRLRSGSRTIDASQVSGEEAVERRTTNVNLVTTIGYGFDERWSVQLRVPVVRREHEHDLIDEASGLPGATERWRFGRLGDVQLLLRREATSDDLESSHSWFGGVKLPTGSIDVVNADGSRAERALQPGSGTTDLVFGVAARRALGSLDALFAQADVTAPLNRREQFRPGVRIDLGGGWSHAFSREIGSVLQLNLRRRAHDRGAQAEPENSGSTTLDLSPGMSLAAGAGSTLYLYAQIPLYQRVRGVQLVPRHAFAAGWTADF